MAEGGRLERWLERWLTRRMADPRSAASLLGDLREQHGVVAATAPWRARMRTAAAVLGVLLRYATRRRTLTDHERTSNPRELLMNGWLHDVRAALRSLHSNPGYALAAIATLALGVGANGAIFGVVRSVLLRPLPYPAPEQLVSLYSVRANRDGHGGISRQDAEEWARSARSVQGLATYTSMEANVTIGGAPARIDYALVEPALFRVLGREPHLGRVFADAENQPGGAPVALLSYGFWVAATGGARDIVGKALTIDGTPHTIVGVMPADFAFPHTETALWRPFAMTPDQTGTRRARWVQAIARVADGSSIAHAQAELRALAAAQAETYPESNADVSVDAVPHLSAQTGSVRGALLFAWAAVGLLLVIVIANVANLVLARAYERTAEFTVRASLGASRARLMRQLVVESVLLGAAGAAAGCALASALIAALRSLGGSEVPRLASAQLDAGAILYTTAIALGAALLFGLAPAHVAARRAANGSLRAAGRGIRRGRDGMRSAGVVVQLALSVAVLIGAGLLARSFEQLNRVEPGFATDDRMLFRIAPDWTTMPERAQAAAFWDNVLRTVGDVPGVLTAGAINKAPLSGNWWTTRFARPGDARAAGELPSAGLRTVTPNYFEAAGITLVSGRTIRAGDRADAEPVAVISRSFAQELFADDDPIGQRLVNPDGAHGITIVGVVEDVRSVSLEAPPQPLVYVPFTQATWGHNGDWGMDVVVQARGADALADDLRRAHLAAAPSLAGYDMRPARALISADLARRRFLLTVIATFALTALVLTCVGIHGITSYSVRQRRAEFGVRLALGARPARLGWLVVSHVLLLAAGGAAAGLLIAASGVRYVSSQLFATRAHDPLTFIAAPCVLLLVALLAAWLPAHRAARAQPRDALGN